MATAHPGAWWIALDYTRAQRPRESCGRWRFLIRRLGGCAERDGRVRREPEGPSSQVLRKRQTGVELPRKIGEKSCFRSEYSDSYY